MALKALALSKKPEEPKERDGEMRKDEHGRGYWHSFAKEKAKAAKKSEPKKEAPKEEKKEPSKQEE